MISSQTHPDDNPLTSKMVLPISYPLRHAFALIFLARTLYLPPIVCHPQQQPQSLYPQIATNYHQQYRPPTNPPPSSNKMPPNFTPPSKPLSQLLLKLLLISSHESNLNL